MTVGAGADGAGRPGPADVPGLLDWRRRVHALYADVRARWPGDPGEAHRRWRQARDRLFATHRQTPLAPQDAAALRRRLGEGRSGLPVWGYDPSLAFTAPLHTDVPPRRFAISTSTGGTVEFVTCGTVALPIGTLEVYWLDAYGGGLFLPFRDATAGEDSYGGGRYLLDTVKGADLGPAPGARRGTGAGDDDPALVLDFNFAYSPSCSYGPQWSCPLAPPANRLEVAVRAGEQRHRPA